MAPPTYGDLGKNARDVFGKGYHFGLLKLDVKTKTDSGVEFSSGGVSNQDTGKVFGTLESKYKIKEYGLTFVEKWNTDNTLGADITLADKPLQGLTIGYSSTFSPQTGNKTGKLKTTYKHENIAATADFDLSLSAGPLINASAVVGYQSKIFIHYNIFYMELQIKLIFMNYRLVGCDNGREFGGSIHHKIKPDLEGAINLAWNSSNNVTQFGLGTKYDLDRDVSVRAKINSQLQIGLGYQQKLHSGVSLTLSANIDGKNFGSGGHKVGFALELEA
ncbi:unnamed protein product [Trichogramma brassicae]|uniref:Voltage-dependent anion-selective channel protein 3 n=1 Tax=Trichogramma brassicae TaxID=86971 RepID=A0A6H5IMD6_9HYME|nr:unnamed protein product [Trichogramma brassicae]